MLDVTAKETDVVLVNDVNHVVINLEDQELNSELISKVVEPKGVLGTVDASDKEKGRALELQNL